VSSLLENHLVQLQQPTSKDDFSKQPCWKLLSCRNVLCPAHDQGRTDCWLIPETHCGHFLEEDFFRKLPHCLNCSYFKVKGEVYSGGWNQFLADQIHQYNVKALERLYQKEESFVEILNRIPDGLFTTDQEWRITYFNPAAEKITGFPACDAVGMFCKDVFKNSICESDCALKRAVAEGQDIHNREYAITNIEGREIPIICSTSAFRDPSGRVTGGLEIFKDITENRKLQEEIVRRGKRNHAAYLTSDHLDVYVATSMRRRHEFLQIHDWTTEIFRQSVLSDLNLRYFDPTQAYCDDRIDKGLAEALMLKRAKCTLYLLQESDTLGKDSELASTLAQGKPVIAFIPEGSAREAERLLKLLKRAYPGRAERDLLLDQLRILDAEAPWDVEQSEIRQWIERPEGVDDKVLWKRFTGKLAARYDKRAETLKNHHPLGIQVDLSTGVANGVLVVRRETDCAKLIAQIATQRLQFDLEPESPDHPGYLLLRERISDSIFRVRTGDEKLSNSFWNFYLQSTDED